MSNQFRRYYQEPWRIRTNLHIPLQYPPHTSTVSESALNPFPHFPQIQPIIPFMRSVEICIRRNKHINIVKKSQHLLSWRLTSGMWHKQNIVERCRMAFWNTAFDGVTVFSHVFWLPLKAHKGWIWVTIKMKSSNQSSQGGHNSSMPPGGISARIFPTPTLERNQCTLLWKASK